jgi:hypothetical protein
MKKFIRIGDMDFIGEEMQITLPEDLSELILRIASKEDLNKVFDTQVSNENYEGAQRIKNKLDEG